jgi:hypothetical protein
MRKCLDESVFVFTVRCIDVQCNEAPLNGLGGCTRDLRRCESGQAANEVAVDAGLACCARIPLVRAMKGSISSAKPSGENIRQWCFSMSGFNLGSTLMRYAHASSRMLPVVDVGCSGLEILGLDGDASVSSSA